MHASIPRTNTHIKEIDRERQKYSDREWGGGKIRMREKERETDSKLVFYYVYTSELLLFAILNWMRMLVPVPTYSFDYLVLSW